MMMMIGGRDGLMGEKVLERECVDKNMFVFQEGFLENGGVGWVFEIFYCFFSSNVVSTGRRSVVWSKGVLLSYGLENFYK